MCEGEEELPLEEGDRCQACGGSKLVKKPEDFLVKVAPGTGNGEHVRFKGRGDEEPGALAGDLIVIVKETPTEGWERRGADLLISQKVPLATAMFGGTLAITHLDGHILSIKVVGGQLKQGGVKVIANEGMPTAPRRGRLFIRVYIELPGAVTPALAQALREAIPPREETSGIDLKSEDVTEVVMQDSDLKSFQQAESNRDRRTGEAYRSDWDDDDSSDDPFGCVPQ